MHFTNAHIEGEAKVPSVRRMRVAVRRFKERTVDFWRSVCRCASSGLGVRSARALKTRGKTIGFLVLLLLIQYIIAMIIAPQIDQTGMRLKIAHEASRKIEGNVVIAKAFLGLFPYPHLTLQGVQVESVRWGRLWAERVQIYPRLGWLLTKGGFVRSLRVEKPTLHLRIPKGAMVTANGKGVLWPLTPDVLCRVPALDVRGGAVNVLKGNGTEPFMTIRAVAGRVERRKTGNLEVELCFTSSAVDRVDVKAEVDAGTGKGSMGLNAEGVAFDRLISLVLGGRVPLTSSRTDLRVDGQLKGWDFLKLAMKGGALQVNLPAGSGTEGVRVHGWTAALERTDGSEITMRFSLSSSAVHQMGLEGRYQLNEGKLYADIDAQGIALEQVLTLATRGKVPFPSAKLDLRAKAELWGRRGLTVRVTGAPLRIACVSETGTKAIQTENWQAVLERMGDHWSAKLGPFDFVWPAVRIGGWADATEGESFSFAGEATGTNVRQLREAVLTLGGSDKTLQSVFEMLRGGKTFRMVCFGKGKDIQDALSMENVRIHGTLSGAKMVEPIGSLALEDVSGQVDISKGVMRARNVSARLGQSIARRGQLVVGLGTGKDVLRVEAEVEADASDLVGCIPKVVTDRSVAEQLRSLRKLEGWAKGRLVLDGSMNQIRSNIELSSFRINIGHVRMGPPVVSVPLSQRGVTIESRGPFRVEVAKTGKIRSSGTLGWSAKSVSRGKYAWKDLEGVVTFDGRGMRAEIHRASLCGISCRGTVFRGDSFTRINMRLGAKAAELSPVVSCLGKKDRIADGTFRLDAELVARGRRNPLKEGSRGSIRFTSRRGRIYQSTILSKVFHLFNVMELYKGRLPDFTRKGFQYDFCTIRGRVKNGVLYLQEAVIDGPAMKIVGEGRIDLAGGDADLVVLVAPMRTVDTVMNSVPILGDVLVGKSGTLISIPFHVKGPIDDPRITCFPPSAVGSGLLGVLKRTISLPVKVIKPVLPGQ